MRTSLLALALLCAVAPSVVLAAPQKNVAIVVYENTEILDFAGPAEVLAAAGNFAGEGGTSALNLYVVARNTSPITSQGFIKIVPQYSIDNAPAPDYVVIPGGNSSNLSDDPEMMKWLSRVTAKSEATLTVCTGAFPLAKTGVFDGMTITTFFGAVDALRALAPKARVEHGRRFVDNGRYITTAGVSAGIDGALHLAARLFGRRVADQTARYMEYHWTPEPYLAAGYAYWNPSTDEHGRGIQAAELAVESKRWGEAIAAFKKLTATDRKGTAWYGLGNAYFHSGDRKSAADAYQKVAKTSPAYRNAVYNLACAYALDGKKAEALAAIKKALALGIKREMAMADTDLASIKDQIAQLP
jgi:putative intracellular protease/amidase